MRKKSRKKKIYEDYVHEENEQELSMDDFESVYIYTQSNRLYMAYHPDRNSDLITSTVYYDWEQRQCEVIWPGFCHPCS